MKQKQLSPYMRALRWLLRAIWFSYLGLLLLIGLVGVVLVPLFRVLAVAFLTSFWLATGIHELGHLIAGRLVGFRFHFVTVGPVKFAREGGRIRINLMKGWSMPSGLAGTLPTGSHDLCRRMTVVLAGGPVASLLLATLLLALYFGLDYHRPRLSDLPLLEQFISATLLLCGLWSLGTLLLTILPIRIGNLPTDGARLLMLRRGGPEAERHCAIGTLVGLAMEGMRPRDWPPALVEAATALPDGSEHDVAGAVLKYSWALDGGDVEEAGRFLDRALDAVDRYPSIARPALYLEAAYFSARHRSDATGARAFLDQSHGGILIEPYTRLRAEAAVLLAEGDHEAARQRASDGLAAIARSGDSRRAQEEADWLQEILSWPATDTACVFPAPRVE